MVLSPGQQMHVIFGANTDVGKTLVSAGLAEARLSHTMPENRYQRVHYVKPLQSGGSDADFVHRHAGSVDLRSSVLFEWDTPTSPHLASRLEHAPCSDEEFLERLFGVLGVDVEEDEVADETHRLTLIETAGGVLSPAGAAPQNQSPHHARRSGADHNNSSWGWLPQADLYQPLLGQCPVVLVGDGRLGGISATLSSLESLLLRGYDVAAVVFVELSADKKFAMSNAEALREYAAGRKFPLRSGSGHAQLTLPDQAIVTIPASEEWPEDPSEPLHDWYDSEPVAEAFYNLNDYLQNAWHGQVADLHSAKSNAKKVIWWPFTQHGSIGEDDDDKVTLIDSASGDYYHALETVKRKPGSPDAPAKAVERRALFDACASWWTQGVGHGNASLALATGAAAGRYGHVIFPNVVHAPALQLAQKLIEGPVGNGWADRVFFTDNGSTAMEVAVKMALKTFQSSRLGLKTQAEVNEFDWHVIAQVDSYHGDTLGVMNLSEPSIFNQKQHPWYQPKGLYLTPPTLGFREGRLVITYPDGCEPPPDDCTTEFECIADAMDVRRRLLAPKIMSAYKEFIDLQWLVYEHKEVKSKIGCVVIEPVLLGAGGMKFVDPLWQRALMDVAVSKNVPIVFDEVASGLHRVGVASCREILARNPDVASYAKLLTGGLLPMSVTLASDEVFQTFYGNDKSQALLHGHSYTANPVGCVAALHALEAYDAILVQDDDEEQVLPQSDNEEDAETATTGDKTPKRRRQISKGPRMLFDESQVRELSVLPIVEQSFALGTVLAVTIKPEQGTAGGYGAAARTTPLVQELRKEHGIYARPLGNVIYIMVTPLTSRQECASLTERLHAVLAKQTQ